MKVITLDDNDFDQACSELADRLIDRGQYDVVVGVRTGGAVVAGKIYEKLLRAGSTSKYFEAGAARGTTRAKKKVGVTAVVRRLPKVFQDALRNMEHFFVSLTTRFSFEQQRSVCIDDDLREYLGVSGDSRVCLIDDAIDSGATVRSIIDEIRKTAPEVEITVAVLVVTLHKPVVHPDVSVFNGVLVRFPWAIDFRGAANE